MGFIAILILVTLMLAGSAAFFSVYGLAQIFTGAFWPVVIMASSLEAGKLVAASYTYRYWKSISWMMKTYLISAIFVLMVITSAGIYGFLAGAYQQDMIGLKQNQQQIALLQEEIIQLETLKQERLDRKKQIDADIAALPNTYVSGRQRLLTSFGPELKQLSADIAQYTQNIRDNTTKISELKSANLHQEAHVGPIIFIAKAFDREVDDTTKWLILIIIFAFDPLAVALTIGANNALLQRKQQSVVDPIPTKQFHSRHDSFPEPHVVEDVPIPSEDVDRFVEPVNLENPIEDQAPVSPTREVQHTTDTIIEPITEIQNDECDEFGHNRNIDRILHRPPQKLS